MTANQIAYARLQEERRSHVAQETETKRSNLEKERENRRANDLGYQSSMYATDINAETQRSNALLNYWANMYSTQQNTILRTREMDIREDELAEKVRSNRAGETISVKGLVVQRQGQETQERIANIQAGASILNNTVGTIGGIARSVLVK